VEQRRKVPKGGDGSERNHRSKRHKHFPNTPDQRHTWPRTMSDSGSNSGSGFLPYLETFAKVSFKTLEMTFFHSKKISQYKLTGVSRYSWNASYD
jgi:hypothetical protein